MDEILLIFSLCERRTFGDGEVYSAKSVRNQLTVELFPRHD